MGLQSDGLTVKRMTVIVILLLIFEGRKIAATDSCNWRGSGLDLPIGEADVTTRVVRPLYLRCAQGRVSWAYPRGGLRILFELRHTKTLQRKHAKNQNFPEDYSRPSISDETLYTSGKSASDRTLFTSGKVASDFSNEFRACIRVSADFSSARIYLEGHRKLQLLHAGQDDPRPLTLKRCFVSVRGRAALYIEAAPKKLQNQNTKTPEETAAHRKRRKEMAEFLYDLRPLSREEYEDDEIECRPCSDQEVLEQYCKSEFVIKGVMTSLWHDPDMEKSDLHVKVSKVLRDSNPKTTLQGQDIILHRAYKCGTKFGVGEFLMMGRNVLGDPTVTCVPRWSDWKRIRNHALLTGSNLCLLDD